MPGFAHLLPYFILGVSEITETEMFAFFKVSRESSICFCMESIKVFYRFLQILVIRNDDFQSSTRDAPFGECFTSFRKCSNGAVIRKRRSESSLK